VKASEVGLVRCRLATNMQDLGPDPVNFFPFFSAMYSKVLDTKPLASLAQCRNQWVCLCAPRRQPRRYRHECQCAGASSCSLQR
jgi:hypothetical protein